MLKYIQGVFFMFEQLLAWYNGLTDSLLGTLVLFVGGVLLLIKGGDWFRKRGLCSLTEYICVRRLCRETHIYYTALLFPLCVIYMCYRKTHIYYITLAFLLTKHKYVTRLRLSAPTQHISVTRLRQLLPRSTYILHNSVR